MSRRANSEGSVYRRKDGKWCASVSYVSPEGTRKRRVMYANSRAKAKARLKEAIRALEDGTPLVESKETLRRFAEVWSAQHLPASGRKPSTIRQYRRCLEYYVLPHLGSTKLKDLSPLSVEAWTISLRESGLAGATVRSAFNVLSAMMATAQRDGLIRRNPCSVVSRPQARNSEATYYSPEEVRALLANSPKDFRPLVYLLAYTGLRIGEALALRWSDVDFEAGSLRVSGSLARTESGVERLDPKTPRSARAIPLVAPVISAIKDQRRFQAKDRLAAGSAWQEHDLVFATSVGSPRDYRNELRRFQSVAREIGLKGGFHALRHSAATALIDAGVPLPTVSSILGHARTSITLDVYGHALPKSTTEAVSRLAAIYES